MTEPQFDDPSELAATAAALPRPIVIGLDVDGVLAPIVDHADDAELADGIGDVVDRLHAVADVTVAIVSGRSLAGLEQFGFSAQLTLIGGHGGEVRGEPAPTLDSQERSRYNLVRHLAEQAAAGAGRGAWVECKPLSVVLHTRQAEPASGLRAHTDLATRAASIPGIKATPGSEVLELFARPASKSVAIALLRRRQPRATIVYVGDDVTDEDAFGALGPDDLAVKVGAGETVAGHRLRDPAAVVAWLNATVSALDDR